MSRALFGTYTKIDFFSFYLSEILNEVGTLCFYLLNLATLLDLNHVLVLPRCKLVCFQAK